MLNKEKSAFGGKTTIIALLIICISLSAQQNDSSHNSLTKGKLALMFSINKDFDLLGLDGGTVSLKYNLSNKFGVRAGLSINSSNNDGQLNNHISNDVTSYFYTNWSYTIKSYFVYYPNPEDVVNVYLALGPLYSWRRIKTDDTSPVLDYYNYTKEWSVGGGLILGAEVFPAKSISLFAEYTPNFYFGKVTRHVIKNYYNEPHNNANYEEIYNISGFDGSSVHLGVSLYFNWPF